MDKNLEVEVTTMVDDERWDDVGWVAAQAALSAMQQAIDNGQEIG